MRLIASDAKRNTHVTNISRHEIIEALRLFSGSFRALCELSSFSAHAVVDQHALALQLCIPLRHLLPIHESRYLNVGMTLCLVFAGVITIWLIVICLIALRLGILLNPCVNATISSVLNLRLSIRSLELQFARPWSINLEPIFIDRHALRKRVLIPEVS